MKLESQVCTLLQAKRMGELGIVQAKSAFFFSHGTILFNNNFNEGEYQYPEYCFSAFTVAELGQLLPEWLYRKRGEYRIKQWQNTVDQYETDDNMRLGYCICYEANGNHRDRIGQIDDEYLAIRHPTEAQARAAMLIHLLESNLVTASDCNKRLANG